MREKIRILVMTLIIGYVCTIFSSPYVKIEKSEVNTIVEVEISSLSTDTYEPTYFPIEQYEIEIVEKPVIDPVIEPEQPAIEEIVHNNEEQVSKEDIELLALLTMAEAEGECEEGQRLVIDTVLNRVDSKYFPDTIHDVIYQPTHFSSMWNGRVDECTVTEEMRELVREELKSRTNSYTIYFNAKHYSKYGEPMFKVGNHYFSSYD